MAYTRKRKRHRRRVGLYLFVGLLVLALGALPFVTGGADPALQSEGESVKRVADQTVAEAPEAGKKASKKEAGDRKAEQAAADTASEKKAARDEEKKEAAAPPPPEDPTLYLTVPKLGVYGHTVLNDNSQQALDIGAIKVPETGFPWQEGDTNTYIAGHRIGFPGTESYYQLYNLPTMQQGDEVILEDSNGTVYTYQVTEMFGVFPWETWVTAPIPGRDVVSLQTSLEAPDDWWSIGPRLFDEGGSPGRLVVRADRVS